MSKELEQAAKQTYPPENRRLINEFGTIEFDKHKIEREAFIKGAEWQKKQDELTWQDVKQIVIADLLLVDDIHITGRGQFPDEQRYYEEVLKIYKEQKNKEL